jgi:hypothetical protein
MLVEQCRSWVVLKRCSQTRSTPFYMNVVSHVYSSWRLEMLFGVRSGSGEGENRLQRRWKRCMQSQLSGSILDGSIEIK